MSGNIVNHTLLQRYETLLRDMGSFLSDSEANTGIYLLKVNNSNSRTRCEICSKLTIKIPQRRQWRRSGNFIVNFGYISHLVLVFLLLALNMQLPVGNAINFSVQPRPKNNRKTQKPKTVRSKDIKQMFTAIEQRRKPRNTTVIE